MSSNVNLLVTFDGAGLLFTKNQPLGISVIFLQRIFVYCNIFTWEYGVQHVEEWNFQLYGLFFVVRPSLCDNYHE